MMKKKPKGQDADTASTLKITYDDAEGLLVNVGVVAALMLSLVVALVWARAPGDYHVTEIRTRFNSDLAFRTEFVKPYLAEKGMALSQTLGNKVVDIESTATVIQGRVA